MPGLFTTLVDFHQSIGAGTRSKLVAIAEDHGDVAAALDPTLRGTIRPHFQSVISSMIEHFQQSVPPTAQALRFEDDTLFLRAGTDIGNRVIRFLVCAEGRGVPEPVIPIEP